MSHEHDLSQIASVSLDPSLFVILGIAGLALLGLVGLLVVLLVSKRTRVWGLFATLMIGVLIVVAGWVRLSAPRPETSVATATTFTSIAANQPRINLDDPGESRRAGITPLLVETEPPAWGDRPSDEYSPESDFGKKLIAQNKADWLLVRWSRSKEGLKPALAKERQQVLEGLRAYVAKRSGTGLTNDAPLGMSTADLFKRFVKARRLVENNGEHTIYTMIVVRNAEGGDELVEKTLALVEDKADKPAAVAADAKQPVPDWVTTPPKRVGEVFRQVLKSGPFATVEECYQDADARLNAVAYRYAHGATLHLGEGSSVVASDDLHAPPGDWGGPAIAELRRRVARDTHIETVDASFGPMKRLYTLVEITPDDGRWLISKRQEHEQQERLGLVVMIAGGVLGLIASVFALLKLDEATRGYYTKRLLIGVPAMIIGSILLFTLVA